MLRFLAFPLVLAMGCGLTQVKGPAANHPTNQRPDCTTSEAPVRRDAYVGGTAVALTLLSGILLSTDPDNPEILQGLLVAGIVTTVAMLASSGVGYSRVKACRRANQDYERTNFTQPPLPGYPQPQPR